MAQKLHDTREYRKQLTINSYESQPHMLATYAQKIILVFDKKNLLLRRTGQNQQHLNLDT